MATHQDWVRTPAPERARVTSEVSDLDPGVKAHRHDAVVSEDDVADDVTVWPHRDDARFRHDDGASLDPNWPRPLALRIA
ncbi:MAG: hypothetical protein ACI9BK_000827 [Acidimicrobiales bacterium]|jgi:hypothetical protein